MNANDIIRAWTDVTFRKSLKAQGIEVPAHPAGASVFTNEDALSDADLDSGIDGARGNSSQKASIKKTRNKSRRNVPGGPMCCPVFK